MKIYNYNKETGELVETTNAKPNPKEEGKFLIPANATSKSPLKPKVDYAVCFVNKAWKYVVDNRSKTYYQNNIKVDFKLGDEITTAMTISQYTAEELADIERLKRIAVVKNLISNINNDSVTIMRSITLGLGTPDENALKDLNDSAILLLEELDTLEG